MRGIFNLSLAVLVAASMASTAAAQMTGSRMGKNAGSKDIPKLTNLVADCVATRQPRMVLGWFQHLPGTDAEFAFVQKQEGDLAICLEDRNLVFSGTFNFTPKALRYPIALATARNMLAKSVTSPAGLNPQGEVWFVTPYQALLNKAGVDMNVLGLHDFGHCVASANWNASRSLILSEEKSGEERAAIAALLPSLGPCLDANATIKMTPQNIRTALAEPMVHLLAPGGV